MPLEIKNSQSDDQAKDHESKGEQIRCRSLFHKIHLLTSHDCNITTMIVAAKTRIMGKEGEKFIICSHLQQQICHNCDFDFHAIV